MKLILASQSRGRRALLSLLNIPFEVIPSTIDEDAIIGKTPLESIKLRAKLKGEDVLQKVFPLKLLNKTMIISSDSGAILDGQLIGKPKDYEDAVRILNNFSGRRHEFVTVVYLFKLPGSLRSPKLLIEKSNVTFKKLSDNDIRTYLSHTHYTRYAGAYALFICPKCPRPGLKDLLSKQKYLDLLEKSCTHTHLPNLIEKIEGSLSNVIGLPLEKLALLLDICKY